MSKIANPTKVITGVNTRWSYANVWDPKSINGDAPKYSVCLCYTMISQIPSLNLSALPSLQSLDTNSM